MAQVFIINSSPRRHSNSRILAANVAEGAESNGHTVKTIEIGRANIRPCIGCYACQKNQNGCVFKDDMTDFYIDLLDAEILIFSSPIYYYNMNGQMKVFLDRTYAILNELGNKKFGGVFTYGDIDPFKSVCINAIRTLQHFNVYDPAKWGWVGAVYGSVFDEGAALNQSELLLSARKFGESLV